MQGTAGQAAMIRPEDITAVILAGGQGRRMGGQDKGLQLLRGQALVDHALQRLTHGHGLACVLISANRNLTDYAARGVPVWPDDPAHGAGPLAGFLTGFAHARTGFVLTVPCDAPRFPPDLAARLARALHLGPADLAMACSPSGQADVPALPQPAFCLMRASLGADLADFTRRGGRQIRAWTARHRCTAVAFDQPGDDPLAFANINTLNDLQQMETLPP